ncbi:rcnR [Klebsiella pneumoniae]|nr:rcnR [Klebsiella pneumoniae]
MARFEAVQRAEQYCAGYKQPGIALLQKGSEIVHIGILAKSAIILLPPSSKILPPQYIKRLIKRIMVCWQALLTTQVGNPGQNETVDRAMSHTVRHKKMLLTRLKKIQGQSTALEKMLNREHECAEILQQLAAIRGAVNGMMLQVIQGHLTDHVVKEPDETQREADLETVMQVIKSYLK